MPLKSAGTMRAARGDVAPASSGRVHGAFLLRLLPAVLCFLVFSSLPVLAQGPPLLREAFTREYSIHAGGEQTPLVKEVVSREISIASGGEPESPYRQAFSREYSIVVTTPIPPERVTQLSVEVSPTGDQAKLDWRGYLEIAQHDVARYRVYLATGPITNVSGLTPYAFIPAGTLMLTISNLTAWQDHYFAVVAEDVLGGFDATVKYASAYVLAPQAITREVSVFVGDEPASPYAQAITREMSLLVTTPQPPERITQLNVAVSPTGEQATLSWCGYVELAQQDVVRYRIYSSTSGFTSVSNLTPTAYVPAGSCSLTLSNLPAWQDRYFAVVAEDALGGFDPVVNYSAAYVLAPQAVTREFSLFVGGEPASPYAQVVSREVSLLVPDSAVPDPVTGISSGFDATTSTNAFSAIDFHWPNYNELAQRDLVRYRLYTANAFFTDVAGMTPTAFAPAGNSRHTLGGLLGGNIYYVAVVAEDALGNFNPTVRSVSAKASIGALGDPRNLAVVSGSNSLRFTWDAPAEVDAFLAHYRVYFNGSTNPVILPPGSTQFDATNLQPASAYAFRVATVDTFATESPGVARLAATWLDNPNNVTGEALDGVVRLAWPHLEPNDLVKHYAVYQSASPFSSVAGMTPVLTTRATRADVGGLANGTPHHFAVTTVNISDGERPAAQSVAVTPNPVTGSFADLTITNVLAPGEVFNGQTISIHWSVTNVGAGLTSTKNGISITGWTDRVLLSVDNVFGDADDVVLAESPHTGGLNSGEGYAGQIAAPVPTNLLGNYYLFVRVDAVEEVYEHLDTATNLALAAQPLHIGPPAPPFITQQPQGREVYEGRAVSFTVGAAGSPPLTYQWRHGSTDVPNGTSATLTLSNAQPVDAGAYSVRITNLAGATNSAPALLTVLPPPPDLIARDLASPSNLEAGQLATVTWTMTNAGLSTAGAPWGERLFLANNPTGNAGTELISLTITNSLAAGGAVFRTVTTIIPSGLSGSYWLAVSVDSVNTVAEDFGETNNFLVSTQAIIVQSPDLSISSLAAPAMAAFGAPFTVNWAVTNSGNGAALSAWNDRVWLSAASNSLAGATLLTTVAADVSPLASAGNYTTNMLVTVPLSDQVGAGNYWLMVQADATEAQPESNENNNLRSAPLTLALPPLPDFVVGNLAAPTNALPGQAVVLTWAITNLGSLGATGAWSETVFLATDNSGGGAFELATYRFTNNLTVGNFLTRTQLVTLPLASSLGDTWFVVRADSQAEVFETSETNNLAVANNATVIPAVLTLEFSGTQVREGAAQPLQAVVTRNGSRAAPLSVTILNSDQSELSAPTNVVIATGQASASFNVFGLADNVVDGPQTVELIAQAAGFSPDSALVTVVDSDLPKLTVTLQTNGVSEGGTITGTVTRDAGLSNAVIVQITASSLSQLSVPASVLIPAGSNGVSFAILALDDTLVEAPAVYALTLTANGHVSTGAALTLRDNDIPVVTIDVLADSVSEGAGPQAATATVTRSFVGARPLVVELQSSDTNALLVPAQVTIPAGALSASVPLACVDNGLVNPARKVDVLGYVLATGVNSRLAGAVPDSLVVTDDDGPTLKVTLARDLVAEGLNLATTGTVSRNTGTNGALLVNLISSDTTEVTVPASVTIPAGASSATFNLVTPADGTNDGNQLVTVTASAAGFTNGNALLTVSDINLPDLIVRSVIAPASAETEAFVNLGYQLFNQGLSATVSNTILQRIYLSSDPLAGDDLLMGQFNFGGSLTPGNQVGQTFQLRLPQAAGDYWVVVETDAGGAVPEILEDNNLAFSAGPIHVAAAYGAVVSTTLTAAPAGTAVPLMGRATNGVGGPAAFGLVNLHIKVRETHRVISALTDGQGNFSTTWLPLANEAGFYEIAAGHPGEANPATQDTFTLLGMRANPATPALTVVEQGTDAGLIEVRNLSDVPLTGLNVSVLSHPANLGVSLGLNTNLLAGLGTNWLSYSLSATDGSIAQGMVQVRITSAEGATLDIPISVTVQALLPRLVSDPAELVTGMKRGAQRLVSFNVANVGGASSGPISISLPGVPWMNVVNPNPLPSLAPGQSNTITLQLTPPADLQLTTFEGSLALNAANAGLTVPFKFRALSEAKGDLKITVVDEYTYYAEGSPKVTNATVVLKDALSGELIVTNGLTDANGEFVVTNLTEGYYDLEVRAHQHSSDRSIHIVLPVQTNSIQVFLSRETVRYTWTVAPNEIEDRTRITIETTFETDVPAPVITIEPSQIDLADITSDVTQIQLTIRNHGLVAANDFRLNFETHPVWKFSPLVEDVGMIPARGAITVPVMIWRGNCTGGDCSGGGGTGGGGTGSGGSSGGNTEAVPCTIAAGGCWTLPCGEQVNTYCAPLQIVNAGDDCSGPLGGGFVINGFSPTGASSSGAVGTIFVQPVSTGTGKPCDSCLLEMLKAVGECAFGFIPLDDLISCALGAKDCYNEASILNCAGAVVSCAAAAGKEVPVVGQVIGVLQCADGLLSACDGPGLWGAIAGLARGEVSAAGDVSILDFPGVAAVLEEGRRLNSYRNLFRSLIGDDAWLTPGQGTNFGVWFGKFSTTIATASEAGQLVAPAERTVLLSGAFPDGLVVSNIVKFIERWNRTVAYDAVGVRELNQVTLGQSTDFIVRSEFSNAVFQVNAAIARDATDGFPDALVGLKTRLDQLRDNLIAASNDEGVCARVQLRLEQEAVLTRDAFQAALELINSTAAPLENVRVDVSVRNSNGQIVTDLFGIRVPTLVGLSAVNGTGIVGPSSTGRATWTLVPSSDAAPIVATNYFVGGTLSYVQGGVVVTIPLSPVSITVLPSPRLAINYFHQRDVFSDDPFTDAIEPSIPYSLAVMVQNKGFGLAKNFHITSAQPQIVENEKGLLADFKIIATEVAGQNLTPSLTADFGTINPGSIAIGRWLMTSTIQGLFVDYKATFEHLDSLGNKKLSLIDEVSIHEMIRLVQVRGAFADDKPDFLVNDLPDLNDYPDTLYLSDGTTNRVEVVTNGVPGGTLSPGNLSINFTAPLPGGWVYLRVLDPANGQYRLKAVMRSDGTNILADNFWITDRTFIGLGRRPIRENILHLLDYNSTGSYTLEYELNPALDVGAPSSSVTALPANSRAQFPVNWSGTDNDGGSGVSFFDVYVSEEGGAFRRWLEATTDTSAVYQGGFGRTYSFYSVAVDRAGNRETAPSTPDAQTTVTLTNHPPALEMLNDITIVEGQTLSLNVAASDPDDDSLSFSLVGNPPPGLFLNSYSGLLTWVTGEAHGPSTNPVTVQVLDRGAPRLGSTRSFTVFVTDDNAPPSLAPITDRTIAEGFLLRITNSAQDFDLPKQLLSFRLAAGAPTNATIHPVSGLFAWRPTELQGGTTNRISVIVADNGVPSASATQSFAVIVRDTQPDFTLSLGTTQLLAGAASRIPLWLRSGADLTNLHWVLAVSSDRLTNLNLQALAPEVAAAEFQALGSNRFNAVFRSRADAVLQGDLPLAQLAFAAVSNGPSSVVRLTGESLRGERASSPLPLVGSTADGRAFVVAREPILDGLLVTNRQLALNLYALPGRRYALQSRPALGGTNSWKLVELLAPATLKSEATLVPAAAGLELFRVYELPPSDLSLRMDSGTAMIEWPVDCAGCVLEETDSLGGGAVWVRSAVSPQRVGDHIQVTLPPGASRRYYRLAIPLP